MSKTSIHTIAKDLNISATTISFIINGKGKERRISGDVIKKVQTYLKKIDYKPNAIAKILRTGKSHTIGMLMEDISDPFFSSIARGVEEGFLELGYKIFFSSTKNRSSNALSTLKVLEDHQVDAYIIAPTPGIELEIRSLLEERKPVVLFDRYFPSVKTFNVVVNNREGSRMGTQHLFDKGYKNVAFVTLESNQIQMTERYQGYMDSIKKNGQKKGCILNVPYNMDYSQTAELIATFFKQNKKVGAVLFATNYLAISGLSALKTLKISTPDEMGIVGFDDNTNFALFSPSITAIAQPIKAIADEIVKMLTNIFNNGSRRISPYTVVLPVNLIERESSQNK